MKRPQLVLGLIWLMMFVAYFDRINITVAGPAIVKSLDLPPAAFGLVLSAFTFGYALMQIPGGALADRFGSRPLLIFALILWSLFTGLTGLANVLRDIRRQPGSIHAPAGKVDENRLQHILEFPDIAWPVITDQSIERPRSEALDA